MCRSKYAMALGFFLLLTPIAHAGESQPWHAYEGPPLVKTSHDAITLAHALWRALEPKLVVLDEQSWQQNFVATLHDGVWEVDSKPDNSRSYGTFTIYVGAQDGRFLGSVVND